MKIIKGKAALVTGAASGIGRAVAMELARQGADVALLDVDEAGLIVVDAEIHRFAPAVRTVNIPCDVSQPPAITTAVKNAIATLGRIDILVNCAGVAHYGATERMTEAHWNRVLDVNLHAPIRFIRELLPHLLARPETHIVNVASIYGLMGERKIVAYSATKFALVGLSESLWAEFAGRGVGVSVICPGYVRTNLFQSATNSSQDKPRRIPPAWLCSTPESIARSVVSAIRRNRRVVVLSAMAKTIWYLQRFAPWMLSGMKRLRWKKRRRSEPTARESEPVL